MQFYNIVVDNNSYNNNNINNDNILCNFMDISEASILYTCTEVLITMLPDRLTTVVTNGTCIRVLGRGQVSWLKLHKHDLTTAVCRG